MGPASEIRPRPEPTARETLGHLLLEAEEAPRAPVHGPRRRQGFFPLLRTWPFKREGSLGSLPRDLKSSWGQG